MDGLEDILRIVIYLAIGIAVVVGRRKGNMRKRRHPSHSLDEPMQVPPMPSPPHTVLTQTSSIPSAPTPDHKPSRKRKSGHKISTIEQTKQQSTYDFNIRADRKSSLSDPATLSTAPAKEQQGNAETQCGFNLREAVIFSEILKPKFDEQ